MGEQYKTGSGFYFVNSTVTKRVGQHDVSSTCRLFWILVSRRQEVLQLRKIAVAVSRTSRIVQYVHFLVAIYPSFLCVSLGPKYLYVSILLESYSVQILIYRITIFSDESYYNDGNHILINWLQKYFTDDLFQHKNIQHLTIQPIRKTMICTIQWFKY
jgi:hypothetical protein